MKKWVYLDLGKGQEVTTLLFHAKYNYDLYSFPNFLIGVAGVNDTIAVIDKDFTGNIKKGDRVQVLPLQWSQAEKAMKPVLRVYNKSKINDLYCKVGVVYYGKIGRINGK